MKKNKIYFWPLISFSILLVSGLAIFYFLEKKIALDFENEKTFTSDVALSAVNHEQVESLVKLLPVDISTTENYIRLKEQVVSLGSIFSKNGIDSIYLLTKKDNKIYFIVDSTPEGQPLYIFPGKLYEQPPVEIFNSFDKGQIFSTDVYKDEYGTYLSQFTPVFNKAGQQIAVLGVDINYNHYQDHITQAKIIFWIEWFFFCLLLNLIFLYFVKSHQSRKESIVSENKIMAISNSINDGIIVINSDSKIVFWNKTSDKIFGYSFDQAIGSKFSDLIKLDEVINIRTGEKIKKFNLLFDVSFADNILEIKLKRIKKDLRYYELHFSLTDINNESNLVCIFHDITLRKESEAKLEEQKDELKKLNDLMLGRELKMIELKKIIKENNI
jgi:PAS domain S-box-containing protein